MVSVMLEAKCDVGVKMGIPATVTPMSLAEDLGLDDIVELLSKFTVSRWEVLPQNISFHRKMDCWGTAKFDFWLYWSVAL